MLISQLLFYFKVTACLLIDINWDSLAFYEFVFFISIINILFSVFQTEGRSESHPREDKARGLDMESVHTLLHFGRQFKSEITFKDTR